MRGQGGAEISNDGSGGGGGDVHGAAVRSHEKPGKSDEVTKFAEAEPADQ